MQSPSDTPLKKSKFGLFRNSVSVLVGCLILSTSMAQTQLTPNAAAAMGDQLGRTGKTTVGNAVKGNASPATTVPGYAGNTNSTGLFQNGQQSGLQGLGTAAVANCQGRDNDPSCAAVNTMVMSPDTRPEFVIPNSDPLLTGYKGIVNDPSRLAGDLINNVNSTYTSCETTTVKDPPKVELQTCIDYSVLENKTCRIGQAIQVDPDYLYSCQQTVQSNAYRQCTIGRVIVIDTKYNYQCEQSPNKVTNTSCTRTLQVTCTGGGDGCDAGGIIPGSVDGDMRVQWTAQGYGYWYLDFGTIGDNYWTGARYNGTIFDRTLNFTVVDASKITSFILEYAAFDDYVGVWLNGENVFVGPYKSVMPPAPEDTTKNILEIIPNAQIPTYPYCGWNAGANGWYCGSSASNANTLFRAKSDRVSCSCTESLNGDTCSRYTCGATASVQRGVSQVKYGTDPEDVGYPDLETNWSHPIWKELKSKLRTGANSVRVRTVVANKGESFVRFDTKQVCPANCADSWVNNCAALENRSR